MNKTKKAVLMKANPFIASLLAVIIDEFGVESLNWDIETIRMELEECADMELSETVIAKIGCALEVMTSDSFYKSLPDFITICNTATGDLSNPGAWNPADAYEIVSAVSEIRLINPVENPAKDIAPDIIAYIEVVLRDFGVINPPNCLEFIPAKNLAIQDIGTVSEDPQLVAAGYQLAQESADELSTYEDNVLTELLTELRTLELENGSIDNLFKGKQDAEHQRTE